MLEDDYSRELTTVYTNSKCDLVIPAALKEELVKRGATPTVHNESRQFARYHYNGRALLEYEQSLPAIDRQHTTARIVTRNVSRSGMAFLHSEQLFPNEEVVVWLPTGKHRYRVARCRAYHAKCYEIGAESLDKTSIPVSPRELCSDS